MCAFVFATATVCSLRSKTAQEIAVSYSKSAEYAFAIEVSLDLRVCAAAAVALLVVVCHIDCFMQASAMKKVRLTCQLSSRRSCAQAS